MGKVIGAGLKRAKDLAGQGSQASNGSTPTRPRPPVDEPEEQVETVAAEELISLPIAQIRPSRYQNRLKVNQDEYERLRKSIQKDFERGKARIILSVTRDEENGSFYNPTRGGHLRLQAASEVGMKEILAIYEEADREDQARGYWSENHGRQTTGFLEDGDYFLQLQQDFRWSVQRIADELYVDGGRDYVERCVLAAKDPQYLRDLSLEVPDRAMRVLVYLRHLDAVENAEQKAAPLIAAFKAGKITADEVNTGVDQIIKGQPFVFEEKAITQLKRQTAIVSTGKSVYKLRKQLGDGIPSSEEREKWEEIARIANEVLQRR